jgi:hypothetical protein
MKTPREIAYQLDQIEEKLRGQEGSLDAKIKAEMECWQGLSGEDLTASLLRGKGPASREGITVDAWRASMMVLREYLGLEVA